ncbi:TauD/TfdA family dioxygenase [Streptomyces endophyticus]|uniref:TauD/TfdA family dioxygenase n=1 Tax=Streptomyces endophyticus TaxID=714166 RepID=A0ABU6F893_9ACTN|nr:TauD/TfdA family dioxygenase [Streptomyces endophyticus]MEB8340241.1 TauD/TfdA family dioxygenase [Streptomyces endophyticus]
MARVDVPGSPGGGGFSTATFAEVRLPDEVRDLLGDRLARDRDPFEDIDEASAHCHQAFAQLPLDALRSLLDFGRHPDAPGVTFVRNLPVDRLLPPTPRDGGPSLGKRTFVAEGVLLGLSGLLGEPVGFLSEREGRLVHDVVPVARGAATQTSQGSTVFLTFHNDLVHDRQECYSRPGPDFVVLNCLRADREGAAATYYADARDVVGLLDGATLDVLRSPVFRMNAPGGFVSALVEGHEAYSDPVPVLRGPGEFPEVVSAANGVRPLTTAGRAALETFQTACRAVAHEVRLAPGQALLLHNRKGVHARSRYTARYDGRDRWLQRTYVRRNLWDIRHRSLPGVRRIH